MKAKINNGNSLLFFLVFVLTGMLLFSNCKKPQDDFEGKATGLKNGETWNAKCISGYEKYHEDEIFIILRTYSKEGFIREDLAVLRNPLSVGDYVIKKVAVDSNGQVSVNNWADYGTLIDDGDVLGDYYEVLESDSANNILELTSIDLDNLIVRGKFSVSFILADSIPVRDTIRFTNVEFQTQINEDL